MKFRVPVFGTAGKVVVIDTNPGAQIGESLRLPDGTVATVANLAALLSAENAGTVAAAVAHGGLSGLQTGNDHPQYGLKAAAETVAGVWNFSASLKIGGTLLQEYVEDTVGAALLDTASVDLTYNDTTGKISADIVNEYVEDRVGGMLANTASITFTYNDSAGTFSAAVVDSYIISISPPPLRDIFMFMGA